MQLRWFVLAEIRRSNCPSMVQFIYFLLEPVPYFRGAVYADMGHFERCITLWMYALDMQQKILEPLSPMTQSSLLSFAELFSFMMSEGGQKTLSLFSSLLFTQKKIPQDMVGCIFYIIFEVDHD